MSNKLKAITTKAKALYKSGKFAKWTDAIKAAAASLPGAKKKTKKIGDYALNKTDFYETRLALSPRKKKLKKIKQYSVSRNADGTFKDNGIKRISGVKKAARKKSAVRNYGSHKDTASHNVKISVMSGKGKSSYELYGNVTDDIKKAKNCIIFAQNAILRLNYFKNEATARKSIKMWKDYIKEYKTHITQLKKYI